MKINQVAELTGLTKKNIRFYEEQGLVDPDRDPGNGYREYSLADVEQLKRVKLLRQLGVSCENIRRVKDGSLALDQCLRDRQRELEAESHDLEQMKEMCRMMEDDVDELSAVDASTYLEKMAELEKGGVRFMTVKKSDVRKRKLGAIIAALVVAAFMLALILLVLWADREDPAPRGVLIFTIAMFGSIAVGVLIALVQRLKEVKGGELDEADKY